MIGAREIDHLKVKGLLPKVGGMLECDWELYAPEGSDSDSRDDPKEGSSVGREALS